MAVNGNGDVDDLVDFLLTQLDSSEIPEQFLAPKQVVLVKNTRGVASTTPTAQREIPAGLRYEDLASSSFGFLIEMGFHAADVVTAHTRTHGDTGLAYEILVNAVANVSPPPYPPRAPTPPDLLDAPPPPLEPSEELADEHMVLEAMFEGLFELDPSNRKWTVRFETEKVQGTCALTVEIPLFSDYPASLPHVYLSNPHFAPPNVPRLVAALVLQCVEHAGEPATYHLWDWLVGQQNLAVLLESLNDPSVEISHRRKNGRAKPQPMSTLLSISDEPAQERPTTQPTTQSNPANTVIVEVGLPRAVRVRNDAHPSTTPLDWFAPGSADPVSSGKAQERPLTPSLPSQEVNRPERGSSASSPAKAAPVEPSDAAPEQQTGGDEGEDEKGDMALSAIEDVRAAIRQAEEALRDVSRVVEATRGKAGGGPSKQGGKPKPEFSWLKKQERVSREVAARESDALLRDLKAKGKTAKYQEMMAVRERLPAHTLQEKIISTVGSNQVVVISGETGCGKTTQIPQFLLDHMIRTHQGAACRIFCTQPRRISAIGVAERVAQERCEEVGQTVGYQIRLEKRTSARTRLLFCTTGILLRMLQGDPELEGVSHVIVDEIHERDLNSDFLLIILKGMLSMRPDLRVVLMSATLNAHLFSAYFHDCPVIHIPGRTFPVTEIFLEEIVRLTKYEADPKSDYTHAKVPRPIPAPKRSLSGGDTSPPEPEDSQCSIGQLKQRYPGYKPKVLDTLQMLDEEKVNVDLIEQVVLYIGENSDEGAVLVFLPGLAEITAVYDRLNASPMIGGTNKYRIIPLHSTLSSEDQHRVFERPPAGVRKVVLSTNIAETSITVDDVTFVIDTGKIKENHYDPVTKVPSLTLCWVSKANARQRKGRAGRVKPGTCFSLYSSHRFAQLAEYQLPEMLRVPLSELCLQIRLLDLGRCKEFLMRALEPPSEEAVNDSLGTLRMLDALDADEELTALGYHLAQLPVDVRIGRMLVYGSILSCLDPILTLAAGMSHRSPFMAPFDKRDEADKARKKLSSNCQSDHLTLLTAYSTWRTADSRTSARDYCFENFLSMTTLRMISEMKRQFCLLLYDIGFAASSKRNPHTSDWEFGNASYNANSHNSAVVRSVLVAGMYPNICKVERLSPSPKLCTKEGSVDIHPASVLYGESRLAHRWLVYHAIVKTSKVFLRDATTVSPYSLLMFGGDIHIRHRQQSRSVVSIDKWIEFECPRIVGALVKSIRAKLDMMLLYKIENPREDLSQIGLSVIDAIVHLITQN